MNDSESDRRRRRWINLGELIALAALIVSALGVWISWKGNGEDKPTRVVEQRQSIPLTLRAKADGDGRTLTISPVESSHALESLTLTIAGAAPITVGSDGELGASDVEAALKSRDKEPKDKTLSVPVRIAARYVEAGADRHGGGTYTLRYRWDGGGLFGGRSLRLVSLSR
ncbi:MAG TPA: hypothetical protein VN106_06725 [Sphingomicrobium sp.]|nr:hypothetical protein [Sphingomicrobium sp.]